MKYNHDATQHNTPTLVRRCSLVVANAQWQQRYTFAADLQQQLQASQDYLAQYKVQAQQQKCAAVKAVEQATNLKWQLSTPPAAAPAPCITRCSSVNPPTPPSARKPWPAAAMAVAVLIRITDELRKLMEKSGESGNNLNSDALHNTATQ